MARLQVIKPVALRQVIDVDGKLVRTGDMEVPNPAHTYDETHPMVRAYPWAFASPDEVARQREADRTRTSVGIEQATAAPGEKRNVRRRRGKPSAPAADPEADGEQDGEDPGE